MPHLLIIRHTNTQPSAQLANKAWKVTTEGVDRVQQLARALAPYQIGKLYTSTFAKTQVTGQLLAQHLDLQIDGAMSAFDENDRSGFPYHETREAFVAAIKTYFERPSEIVIGNESAEQVQKRFADGVASVTKNSAEQAIAIITHGVAPAHFIASHTQERPFDVWLQIQSLGMPCYFVFTLPHMQLVAAAGITAD